MNELAFTLEIKLASGSIGKLRFHMSVSLFSNENFSRRRGPLQPRRDVDSVSQHCVIRDCPSAHVADKGRPRSDSRAKMKVLTDGQPIHASENP